MHNPNISQEAESRITEWVMDKSNLRPTTKVIFQQMLTHANGEVLSSTPEEIASWAGLHAETVAMHIKRLEDLKLLRTVENWQRNRRKTYVLMFPAHLLDTHHEDA